MSAPACLLLAAGAGTRLRPLTLLRPKSLCPVDNVPLLDHALSRIGAIVDVSPEHCAVNAHHLADQIVGWAAGRVRVQVEQPVALGTAGAVGNLRNWLAGRDVLIVNADAFFVGEIDVASFVDGWDGRQPRLIVVEDLARPDFDGRWRFAGISLLPGPTAATLPAVPSGLFESVWSRTDVDLVPATARYFDCGTPRDYLDANLAASGGRSVVHPTATVSGDLDGCVVWPDAVVRAGERLFRCIRARNVDGSDMTVPVLG